MKGGTVALMAAGGIGLVLGAMALAATATDAAGGGDIANSRDVEALARMLASENPKGSVRLWIEQIWTQIASRKRGQSLYERVTGGAGYGPQNKQRPVSTEQPASEAHRVVARLVLLGAELATLKGARKFFEPAQQDQLFKLAQNARAKLARGEKITPRERRVLGYEHDADSLRQKWSKEGARFVGNVDGVEFWT